MTFTSKLAFASLLAFSCGLAHAQGSCGQLQSTTFPCGANSNVGPCGQSVTISYPQSTECGLLITTGFVSCCGSNYQTAYSTGGNCLTAEFHDPAVQRQLMKLSSTQPLLIASCTGKYEHLVPSAFLLKIKEPGIVWAMK